MRGRSYCFFELLSRRLLLDLLSLAGDWYLLSLLELFLYLEQYGLIEWMCLS